MILMALNCLIYNIRKPQIALKLISKYRKPLGCVKLEYRSFCKVAQKIVQNRITANPYAPLYDSSEFFYRHATVATYRIPGELQGLYRERRGRERERERATVELKLARDRPERSVPIRKKKKKHSGTQGRVTCGFQYISFCVTRMLRDHLVERLLCDY